MKIQFLFFFLLYLFISCDNNSNRILINGKYSQNYDTLNWFKRRVSYYIDKSVGLIIADCKWKEIKFIINDEPPGVVNSVIFRLENNKSIQLWVSKYKYMEPFDTNRKWNIELYKKENIGTINLITNSQCDTCVSYW